MSTLSLLFPPLLLSSPSQLKEFPIPTHILILS